MDQVTQAQSNISGSHSGNRGNNNVAGDNNTINYIYGQPDGTNLGVGNQGGVPGAGDGASRPYHLIPYSRNNTFTGRGNLIESVRRFSQGPGHNRVALYGLGGSGKTQIALEYVYQCISESDCNVFWVQGSGELKFSEGFRAIAQRARIPLVNAEGDGEDFLLDVRRWLEGPSSGDWILVVDNADNEADFVASGSPIARFIPQGPKGTLVFTTRSRQVASRQGCKMIEVGKMGEEEAKELFSKRFDAWDSLGDKEKEAIAMILDSVHHLPLAIVGSAAFMIETTTPPSVYLTTFQKNEEPMKKLLSQQFCDIQRESDVTESVLGTYFVTFDRIGRQMPAAVDLLRLMVFFDRQNIPEQLLSQCGLEGVDDPVEFRRAVGKLLGFSLVTSVERENGTFYELHRLIQLSLQVYLPTEDLKRAKAAALEVISQSFPRYPDDRRYLGPAYIPHALAVTKDSTGPAAEALCFRMGRYFLHIGSYSNAETQFRRCIELRGDGKEYDWDDQGPLRVLLLGIVCARQGKYDESETLNRCLLEEHQRILGPDHPDTLTSANNLAGVLWDQGKYDESEAINRLVLGLREKTLGPDHPNTLTSLNNLATTLLGQGRYDESETMNRRALERCEKVLGPDHPDTLTGVNNLAMALHGQGRYDESETMNRRALEGREKVLGPDHPITLESVSSLAMTLWWQGRYDESETMNRRALERCEKVLGPDHPATLASVNNLAMALRGQGRYGESEMMNRCALERREKVLGLDHPATLISVNSLARVLWDQGKYDEAETMNRRARERREEVLGPDHPDTLISVNNLAMVLWGQGKHHESERMNRRALEQREKVLGPGHPDTLLSVNNLAIVLQGQGKHNESETMNRRAFEGYEKVLGPDHPDTLAAVNNLAVVLLRQRKYDESGTMIQRALDVYEKVLGPDHPTTLTSANDLAIVLRRQGKYNEAEAMNRRALEGYEKVLGPDHPHTLTSVRNLAVVLRDQEKYNESETMNRRAQETTTKTGPDGTTIYIGHPVLRFLRAALLGKNDGSAK